MLCGNKVPTDSPAEGLCGARAGGPGGEAGAGCLGEGWGRTARRPGSPAGVPHSATQAVFVLRSRWPSPVQVTLFCLLLLILFP